MVLCFAVPPRLRFWAAEAGSWWLFFLEFSTSMSSLAFTSGVKLQYVTLYPKPPCFREINTSFYFIFFLRWPEILFIQKCWPSLTFCWQFQFHNRTFSSLLEKGRVQWSQLVAILTAGRQLGEISIASKYLKNKSHIVNYSSEIFCWPSAKGLREHRAKE